MGEVVFAGHRILERVAASFANAFDFECALGPVAFNRDLGLLQPDDFERGSSRLYVFGDGASGSGRDKRV